MKIIGVIPARYASTRFPGKPLADICGKPMVWWVWNAVRQVTALNEVYVATDSEKISGICEQYGIPFIMTSNGCETCTDRIAEVMLSIDADMYVSVLGDEPCIRSEDIESAVELSLNSPDAAAVTICLPIQNAVDAINTTTQKFALNKDNDVIFISRQPIPYPQQITSYDIYKHVGIYVFRKRALEFFSSTPMGRIESIEGNDLMRFIENHKLVKAHITQSVSLSVDTPKDLEKVRKIMLARDVKDEN